MEVAKRGKSNLYSGIPYTIIRLYALTAEPGVTQLIFDQGDNIKGKVSLDAIAQCLQVQSTTDQPKMQEGIDDFTILFI